MEVIVVFHEKADQVLSVQLSYDKAPCLKELELTTGTLHHWNPRLWEQVALISNSVTKWDVNFHENQLNFVNTLKVFLMVNFVNKVQTRAFIFSGWIDRGKTFS